MNTKSDQGNVSQWVYGFGELDKASATVSDDWEAVRGLLGGKGANLADMVRLGIPVPPGFTVTTRACNAYIDQDELPAGLWDQVLSAMEDLESETGLGFGDPTKPLLVACRSGAKFSMPGMMDTVLDIGMNDEVAARMIERTEDPRFVYDSYRRLIQMFGSVVLGVRDEPFEDVLYEYRTKRGVENDSGLTADDLREIVDRFKAVVDSQARAPFPSDPYEQLKLAVIAVFDSWGSRRAKDYRRAAGISDDLGTAVNVVTMVFGNTGDDSATGVAMSRNATTGESRLEGDYLINAQGEDVVAGTRPTLPISQLAEDMPEAAAQFADIAKRLEAHYRDMQDMEFTIEHGRLWLLQTRNGKRTAQAEVRIAVDLVNEGMISKSEAVTRVSPDQVDFFLHPQFPISVRSEARLLGTGLNVSPGAAAGVVVLDPDLAQQWAEEGREVLLVRPETKPDDVHGMLAATGILTSSGGRTSHAALVARQFGKPAVVGASDLSLDMSERTIAVDGLIIREGDWLSIDGNTGNIYLGKLETATPDLEDPFLATLLGWADEFRTLGVRANADEPSDAERARAYGAEGIGLCRTEHMFFDPERLPIVQQLIMARTDWERREAVDQLLPFQRDDMAGLLKSMDGLPVIIRLLDPPMHEFLPSFEDLFRERTELQLQLARTTDLDEVERLVHHLSTAQSQLDRVRELSETNPMLGLRGVRLGLTIPELTRMQARAIFEAYAMVKKQGGDPHPEIMIPLVSDVAELAIQRTWILEEAAKVAEEQGIEVVCPVGSMIEVPRAALTADKIAVEADFLSFGTNDLTQTTFAISRDDAEASFLLKYVTDGLLPYNPFTTLDTEGVAEMVRIAMEGAHKTKPEIETGVCGEHGGDPQSIATCHKLGLNYVSCSPFRVPVARLAAAHAALADKADQE